MIFSFRSILLWFSIFSSCAVAAPNTNLIHTDSSIEEFQRKVVFINPRNGYESIDVYADVKYCQLNAKICDSRGKWAFKLSNALIATDATNLTKWVGLVNLDTLKLTNEQISISASYGNIVFPSSGEMPSGGVSTFSDYRNSFEAVLKSRSVGIATSLANAVDMRAKRLNAKKSSISRTGNIKSSRLDTEALKNVMDDGFAFANYVPIVAADVTISEVQLKNAVSGAKEIHYSVSVNATVAIQMVSYHFDVNEKMFKPYKEWTGDSDRYSPESKIYNSIPDHQADVQDLFDTAYSAAYKAAALNLFEQIEGNENLFPVAKISDLRGNFYVTNLNPNESLRVDSSWLLSRVIDGERQQIGLGKAVRLAPLPKEGEEAYSIFKIVKGDASKGDQVRELSSSGVKVVFGGALVGTNLTSVGDNSATLTSSKTKESLNGLKVGVAMDLGYLRNLETLSDLWLTSNLIWAQGSEFNLGGISMNAPVFNSADIGIEKTYFMGGRGFSISPTLGFAYSQFSASGVGSISANAYSFSFAEMKLKLGIAFDYTFDNFNDLSLGLEYPVQLASNGLLTNQATSANYSLSNNSFGQSISIYLLYRLGIDSSGFMSVFMK
jgi:hypothetical protein